MASRRWVVTAAKGKMEEALDREIEATAAAIDAMVREVTQELFVDTAAAYVTGEMPPVMGFVPF